MYKKIVFTGGLSCGKTTTINMLRDLGHSVVSENSEAMINNYKRINDCYPWENKHDALSFHKDVFRKQMEAEKKLSRGVTFFDRGLPDRLVFLKFDKLQISKEISDYAKLCNYHKIFFFEGDKSIYEMAPHRPHDIKYSDKIEKAMKEMYINLGYDVITVPFCSREDRVEIILKELI